MNSGGYCENIFSFPEKRAQNYDLIMKIFICGNQLDGVGINLLAMLNKKSITVMKN